MIIHIICDAKSISRKVHKLFPASSRKKNNYCIRVLYGVRFTLDNSDKTINCDIIERYEIISLIDDQEYYLNNTGSTSILLHQLGYHIVARFDLQFVDGERAFTKSTFNAQRINTKVVCDSQSAHIEIKTTDKLEPILIVEDLCDYRGAALSLSCPITEDPTYESDDFKK